MESKNSNVLKFVNKNADTSKHISGDRIFEEVLNLTLSEIKTVGIKFCLDQYHLRCVSVFQYLCSEAAKVYIVPEKLFTPYHLDLTLSDIMNPDKNHEAIDSLRSRVPDMNKFIFETIESAHRELLYAVVDDHVNSLVSGHLSVALDNLSKTKFINMDQIHAQLLDEVVIEAIREFSANVFSKYFDNKELRMGLLNQTIKNFGHIPLNEMIKAGSLSAVKSYGRDDRLAEVHEENIRLKSMLGERIYKEFKRSLLSAYPNPVPSRIRNKTSNEFVHLRSFALSLTIEEFQALAPYLAGLSETTLETMENDIVSNLINSNSEAA